MLRLGYKRSKLVPYCMAGDLASLYYLRSVADKGVGRKISRGGGEATEKNNEKGQQIPLLSLFRGEGVTEKRPKNSTIKPLSTKSVPCMKI